VAPNDPDSMAPLLHQAADARINVATSDTDAPDSVREVFVNQASTEGIGQALTDALLEAMGGSGKYAIVSCGQTAENLNAWIEVQEAYTAEKYPDAEIVDIERSGDVITLTFANRKKCVINTQRPTRQIWLAANARAWHFSFDEPSGKWLDDKGELVDGKRVELVSQVAAIVKEQAGVDVRVE